MSHYEILTNTAFVRPLLSFDITMYTISVTINYIARNMKPNFIFILYRKEWSCLGSESDDIFDDKNKMDYVRDLPWSQGRTEWEKQKTREAAQANASYIFIIECLSWCFNGSPFKFQLQEFLIGQHAEKLYSASSQPSGRWKGRYIDFHNTSYIFFHCQSYFVQNVSFKFNEWPLIANHSLRLTLWILLRQYKGWSMIYNYQNVLGWIANNGIIIFQDFSRFKLWIKMYINLLRWI